MAEFFDWDGNNRAHIAEHGLSPEEAEQVIFNEPLDLESQLRSREQRTAQVGETDAGRILVVITTWRGGKLRVVTAFPAKKKFRQLYEQRKGADDVGGTEDP